MSDYWTTCGDIGVPLRPVAETAEALFLTQGYVYDSAAQAEAAFKGEVDHYVYSRYGNPSVATFQERLRSPVTDEA